MYCIDVLLEEHDRITDFIAAARKACCSIINGNKVDLQDLNKMLEFGKNYADNLHHKKEEDILFDAMVNEIGGAAQKMIQNGMLVEHNLGRLYLSELEKTLNNFDKSTENKLQIITNLSAYCDLLERHIVKENGVAYPFGQRTLSPQTLERLNKQTEQFETDTENDRKRYLSILNELKQKYC